MMDMEKEGDVITVPQFIGMLIMLAASALALWPIVLFVIQIKN